MKNERYPYIDNPYGFKLPERREVIHPIVRKWDDFPQSDKEIFSKIKREIISVIGNCKISAFGSRINGCWLEDSDYDVMINKGLSNEELDTIKKINYGVKVDILHYEHGTDAPVFSIEII